MKELRQIQNLIAQSGIVCRDGLMEEFYLSLKSKPITFLLGNSDTDMTRLPRLFAGAIGASADNGRYLQLEVKPDWMDSSDLFGWLNLEGKFIPGVIIDFLKAAKDDPENPYFLCLNHVILSRAEYYLRDVLNAMDTRGTEQPLPYVPMIYYGRDETAKAYYGEIPMLENLYLTATVNLDETSLPLNQKLLDRVHTLSVTQGDMTGEETKISTPLDLANDFLTTQYFQPQDAPEAYYAEFEAINQILLKATAYLGFKVRNDGIVYLLHNRETGALSEQAAMDHVICQKVLPRVQGAANLIRPVLESLLLYARERRYQKTADRIARMMDLCDRDGYASCWE